MFVEVVVACGHGSVDGVERRCADEFECDIEVKTFLLYVVYQSLEVEQSGMSFVAVVELAVDAELLQHQDTANAEEVFLLDAVFPVASIELMGDGTVEFAVHVEVGVEQV